jgi:hypothetical protein
LTILDGQLRFFKPNGELVPTPQESAVRQGEAAAQAMQESANAKQEVEQLKAKLRELGIDLG